MSASPTSLLILDGHAAAYRSFHAIRELSSPQGRPTNAVFGFIKSLERLLDWVRPGWAAVIWDGGLAPERLALHPGYKAERPPMPDALAEQIDQIVEWLAARGVASWCREGVEADDWIAALAAQATKRLPGTLVCIASPDKDFMQLVSSRVGLINPNDKSEKVWTADDVRAKAGVAPEQIVDWLSLVGDSVDDIPGLDGVGPKTAAAWLAEFGTLDGILARVDSVRPERLRERLRAGSERLRRNQDLIRLRVDVPFDWEPDRMRIGPQDAGRLSELYARWGFRTLLRDLGRSDVRQTELL